MIIPAATQSSLAKALATTALSASKIATVEGDMTRVRQTHSDGVDALSKTATFALFDARLRQDVESGNLTQTDADQVRKVIANLGDGVFSGDSEDSSPMTNADPGDDANVSRGNAGIGSASGQKSELFRTVLEAGPVEITIIVYSDGTNKTESHVRSNSDATPIVNPYAKKVTAHQVGA